MKPVFTNSIKTIGLMSGTSLDGLDIVAAEFTKSNHKWNYEIMAAETVSYTENWQKRLENAHTLPGKELIELHNAYGVLTGRLVSRFMNTNSYFPDIIASHGHTVFHQPSAGLSFQIGNGIFIAKETKTLTIADFRQDDVALGGEGAPLVPAGDRLLFPEYTYCLNLGGFANISFEKNGKRIAFDICPVNFVLNYLAKKIGFQYDNNGEIGKRGKADQNLIYSLNQLDYYRQPPPKSLGREWTEQFFIPLLSASQISVYDQMRSVYEHIAVQTVKVIEDDNASVLITGGGAYNKFLTDYLAQYTNARLFIPDDQLIKFKEALVFAFLGLLRYFGEINCYSSVTGAKQDTSAGVIFYP
jgi:anhydro-N-acetylmuramic acid kinase